MTDVKQFDGLPFFIASGTKVQTDKLPKVQSALYARLRNVNIWFDRYQKGRQIQTAMKNEESGAVQNINMMYAYNAYQKFLNQSLLSLKDAFRVSTTNYQDDVERPTTILKGYLETLQLENNLIADDAILYGCASLLLDVNLDEETPQILLNRVRSEKIIFDYEQPGSGVFSIRVTPELAWKYTFLEDKYRQYLYNIAISSAQNVAELRVYVGDLVVDNKLDSYLVIVFKKNVIYAEKNRTLTVLRSVSLYDKNTDFSPIYTVMKASELSRENYKLLFDYNDQIVNPIRVGSSTISAQAWQEARRTKYLKLTTPQADLTNLLPGELDVNGLTAIITNIQELSQQAAGLNDYTLGEATGSVRTYGEAMMLADSASGIMNILASKLKQRLIIPALQDILEILKVSTAGISDIFPDSLYIDADIVKDQQEGSMLLNLINMPMFGAIIQGMPPVQALQLVRWIFEKLHIAGTSSVFDTLIEQTVDQTNTNTNNQTNNNQVVAQNNQIRR